MSSTITKLREPNSTWQNPLDAIKDIGAAFNLAVDWMMTANKNGLTRKAIDSSYMAVSPGLQVISNKSSDMRCPPKRYSTDRNPDFTGNAPILPLQCVSFKDVREYDDPDAPPNTYSGYTMNGRVFSGLHFGVFHDAGEKGTPRY
ncbi:hypothetical protein LTR36_008946 [Oleoguttula mirabilis]|uniref:Uncharacterized protein n=1 Tax=Oleoguttula mirabilis TaxID=1507867 RepID=A0AAV9J6Q8_9PEZI|nr:hypothetical protein LTR36_008946 [Oleoguttula mirabilis]